MMMMIVADLMMRMMIVTITLQACRGHCGYPVTHFWRHVGEIAIFFQVGWFSYIP